MLTYILILGLFLSSYADETPKCVSPGLFPHPNRCDVYYICDKDLDSHALQCPRGSVFSPALGRCTSDPGAMAECRTSSLSGRRKRDDYFVRNNWRVLEDETQLEQVESRLETASSEIVCSEPGSFPHPMDCSKYYRCVDWFGDGRRFSVFHFDCPAGAVFDTELENCNFPHLVSGPCGHSAPQGVRPPTNGHSSSQNFGHGSGGLDTSRLYQVGPQYGITSPDGDRLDPQSAGSNNSPHFLPLQETKDPYSSSQNGYPSGPPSQQVLEMEGKSPGRPWSTHQSSLSPDNSGHVNIQSNKPQQGTSEPDRPSTERGQSFSGAPGHLKEGNTLVKSGLGNLANGNREPESSANDNREPGSSANGNREPGNSANGNREPGNSANGNREPGNSANGNRDPGNSAHGNKEPGNLANGNGRPGNQANVNSRPGNSANGNSGPREVSPGNSNAQISFPDKQVTNRPFGGPISGSAQPSGGSNNKDNKNANIGEVSSQEESLNTLVPSGSRNSFTCTAPGFYPVPGSCTRFFRCVDWFGDGSKLTIFTFDCPFGTAFDDEYEICTKSPEAFSRCESGDMENSISGSETSKKGEVSPEDCRYSGYFATLGSCTKYHRCVDWFGNGKKFSVFNFECQDGLEFDEGLGICNYPESVPRCRDAVHSSPMSTHYGGKAPGVSSSGDIQDIGPYEVSPSEDRVKSVSRPDPSGSVSEGGLKVVGSGVDIPVHPQVECKGPGYFRSPQDCTKFYRCVNWGGFSLRFSVFHYECPPGTAFDESLGSCNHLYLVDCNTSALPELEIPPSGSSIHKNTVLVTPTEQTTRRPTARPGQAGVTLIPSTSKPRPDEITSPVGQTTTVGPKGQMTPSSSSSGIKPTSTTTKGQSGTNSGSSGSTQRPPGSTPTVAPSESMITVDVNPSTEMLEAGNMMGEQTTDKTSTTRASISSSGVIGSIDKGTSSESESKNNTKNMKTTAAIGSETGVKSTTFGMESTTSGMESTTSGMESTTSGMESTFSGMMNTSPDKDSTAFGTEVTMTSEMVTDIDGVTTMLEIHNMAMTMLNFTLHCGTKKRHRHPVHCNRYYECVWDGWNFNFTVTMCPEGQVFDEDTLECFQTDSREGCHGDFGTTPRTHQLVTQSGTYTTIPDFSDLFTCSSSGFFPFGADCQKFFKCEKNKSSGKLETLLYKCPDKYQYVEEKGRCLKSGELPPCAEAQLSYRAPLDLIQSAIVLKEEELFTFFGS